MIDLAIEQSRKAFNSEEEERKARLADIEEAFNRHVNDPDYARKLYLIEHCIYGVDIQPIAVQISKLRFFISLVVDQNPTGDAAHNFGIRPLPNLESKFVAANTLIPVKYDGALVETAPEVRKNKVKLKELNHKIFLAKRNVDKQRLKDEIKATRKDLVKAIEDTGFVGHSEAELLAGWDMFEQNVSSPYFDAEWMFGVKGGFDVVIGNPPYGASLSAVEKKFFKQIYKTAQTIKNVQKGSLDTYTLFIEKSFCMLSIGGCLSFIVPISITSSDSLSGVHKMLMNSCKELYVSSYSVRPQPVFENAVVNTSIFLCQRTGTKCENVYSTKMHRKGKNFNLQYLINHLEFTDVKKFLQFGRIPKVGSSIEKRILTKISRFPTIESFVDDNGMPIYYRTSGGRYFKVVTNYPTGSTKEKAILVKGKLRNAIGCLLSSNLGFWYYQIYSNNVDWKYCEITSFPIPPIDNIVLDKLNSLYSEYLTDIERNANVRFNSGSSKYNVDSFKEYKIGKSKAIIDKIDDFICPLYGLTQEEIEFIKNYEIEFRMSDDE